ncbi:MAG: hypothetical protein MJZ00_06965 [Paludibacteraceae bacterium]|nr:hypothetical protein [Paludibacteraceae bacterium]
MIINFMSFYILRGLAKHKICKYANDKNRWIWNESKDLFYYFCWYATELSEQNGLRMYKGIKNTNVDAFKKMFENAPEHDSNIIRRFKEGYIPSNYETVERATKDVLNQILRNVVDVDKDKFLKY